MAAEEKALTNLGFAEIEKAEAHNFQGGLKVFPNEVRHAERIHQLYNIPDGTIPVELVTSLGLFMESAHALVLSVLALLRCHQAQALNEIRRAIECASYGHKAKNPDIAALWLQADEDKKSFNKHFRYENRFDQSHPIIKGWTDTWRMASEFACHATLGAHMGHQANPSPDKFEYAFFDLGDDHLNNRGRLFCFILKTHLQILQVFEEVFTNNLSEKWKKDRQNLTTEIESYFEKCIAPHLAKVDLDQKKKEFAKAGLIYPENGALVSLLKRQ